MYPEEPIFSKGAVLNDAGFILLFMVIVNPIMNTLSPWYFLALFRQWSLKKKIMGGNAQGITQSEAHKGMELPIWNAPFIYAGMVKDMLTCIFLQPLFPISGFVGILSTFLMFWSQKHRLLRHSVKPITIENQIAYSNIYLLSLGVLVWGVNFLLTSVQFGHL